MKRSFLFKGVSVRYRVENAGLFNIEEGLELTFCQLFEI